MVQLISIMTTGKTTALTIQTFFGKVMSLLFKYDILSGNEVQYQYRLRSNTCLSPVNSVKKRKYYIARDNIFFVSFNTLLRAKGKVYYWRRLLRVPWTARRSNQPILKEIVLSVHMKDWCWSWKANTLAIWCNELTHLKRPWCWERLKVGGEGDDRVWDGWMASPTQWTWVSVDSGNWWWTGRPDVLWSMGSQRVRHD